MYSNRRPYYGLKLSIADFFREPVRYLKQSNTQESMMEKPYLIDEYSKMHLDVPDFKYKPKKIKKKPGFFGEIAGDAPSGGFAIISFGDAICDWDIVRTGMCVEGLVDITLNASYFWSEEFSFMPITPEDTIGVNLGTYPPVKAGAWDRQSYALIFPKDANGSITVCGSASTKTLISQTFETKMAGMPVTLNLLGGSIVALEKKAGRATLPKGSYGVRSANCGCITITSSCFDPCSSASIGYTTQQMSVDESQSLTVADSTEGCDYQWSISSGGGGLDGSTYTAPSSNVNCGENPTISLTVNGVVIDTLSLAVNNVTNANAYGTMQDVVVIPHADCDGCSIEEYTYDCDGAYRHVSKQCSSGPWVGDCPEPNPCDAYPCSGDPWYYPSPGTVTDTRTTANKEAGCCPAELL